MGGLIRVEVVYAERGRAWRLRFELTAGDTVESALKRSAGLMHDWPEAAHAPAAIAVFGREVDQATLLVDGDRIELLRELPNDPKQARRERAEARRVR